MLKVDFVYTDDGLAVFWYNGHSRIIVQSHNAGFTTVKFYQIARDLGLRW